VSDAEDIAAAIGAQRRGIVTAHLMTAAGVAAHARATLRRRGVLVPVGRGVDRLRDHPFDHPARCQAALDLAGGGAVLGLRTAARLQHFYTYRRADEVEVLAHRRNDHGTTVGRIVQTRSLPRAHVTEVEGLPVTTVARTFFDLCGDPDPPLRRRGGHPAHERKMRAVYNDALARRGLGFVQEAAVLAVIGKRGRRGTRLVRELLVRFGPEYEPTRSDTESLFMELVWAMGLPEPEKQAALGDVHGFIGVVDFLWRAARLVVEVDSTWHDGPLDFDRDTERDERLTASGYVVKRYRYRHLVAEPDRIRRELGRIVRHIP
jgi:Protein of unknown function (DUF559)